MGDRVRWFWKTGVALAALSALVAGCVVDEDEYDVGQEVEEVSASNLGGANLGGANLGGANLGGANLGGANLGGVNLGGANLSASNLGGANLGGNNLGGANLAGAGLSGANLAGANLGGTSLSGSTLVRSTLSGSTSVGAYPGLGCPVAGTVRLGTDLTAATLAIDIHDLGARKTMLRTGEDAFTRARSCVVLGLGSMALPRLIQQNPGDTVLRAAVGKTPWGVARGAGGPLSLAAWEVVIWGSTRYSVFIVLAPPEADHAGVTGFVKAVWRWAAPPSKRLRIGSIGGREPVQSYGGMMGAGAHALAGTISHRTYVAGELSFATATTNNVSVNVDFSAAVVKKDGTTLILGNVEGAPPYFEGAYVAVERRDGSAQVVIDSRASQSVRADDTIVVDSLREVDRAYELYPDTPPVPRRCAGWKRLAWYGVTPPDGKCDDGVALDTNVTLTVVSSSWAPILAAAGRPVVLPYNEAMLPPTEFAGGRAVTYIALNEPGYDMPGQDDFVFDVSTTMGQRAGSVCTAVDGTLQVSSHVASPTVGDWVGLFRTGAPDGAPELRYFTSSCGPSAGPSAVQRRGCVMRYAPTQISQRARYELRLFSGGVRVATSPVAQAGSDLVYACGI